MDNVVGNVPEEVVVQAPAKKKNKLLLIISLVCLVLVVTGIVGGSIWFLKSKQNTSTGNNKSSQGQESNNPNGLHLSDSISGDIPTFAEFKLENVSFKPALLNTPVKIDELTNINDVQTATKQNLSQAQKDALNSQGFFVTDSANLLKDGDREIDFMHGTSSDEFLMLYSKIAGSADPTKRMPENSVFLTTDLALHSYHVFIDRLFQDIEQKEFQPKLLSISSQLYDAAKKEYNGANNEKQKESLSRLIAFFAVPKIILETADTEKIETMYADVEGDKSTSSGPIDTKENALAKLSKLKGELPVGVETKIQTEIERIYDAKQILPSSLFGQFLPEDLHDYTQYKPRSHYDKNSLLRSYWRAMIWYGRTGLLVKSVDLTRDAANITLLLAGTGEGDTKVIKLWSDIYLPTVFFVGKSDDLGYFDYIDLIKQTAGNSDLFSVVKDDNKLAVFSEKLKALPGPKIQSSVIDLRALDKTPTKDALLEGTKGFRFMGQRFIPDSFIFSKLTQGDEAADPETGQSLPAIPTALMPFSVWGNKQATTRLGDWIIKNAPNSDKVIAREANKLTTAFGKVTTAQWTQNMYWSWIYTLKAMFDTAGEGYPFFMRSTAWNDKNLTTILGSWTELRHDTLLYAKQSYAEMGGGPPDEAKTQPVPLSYVEPNVNLYNRLWALNEMTKSGLSKLGLIDKSTENKFKKLSDAYAFMRDISIKELQNEKLSEEELEKIRVETLGTLNNALIPTEGGYMTARDARAGLIADVHTSVSQKNPGILYEGTGIPLTIYVAIKDINGTRLTRGIVYSQYEFVGPVGERYNDADWQQKVYEGKGNVPTKPDWVAAIYK